MKKKQIDFFSFIIILISVFHSIYIYDDARRKTNAKTGP